MRQTLGKLPCPAYFGAVISNPQTVVTIIFNSNGERHVRSAQSGILVKFDQITDSVLYAGLRAVTQDFNIQKIGGGAIIVGFEG